MRRLLGCRFDDCLQWLLLLLFDSLIVIFCFWAGYELWAVTPYRMKAVIPDLNWSFIIFDAFVFLLVMMWGGTYRLDSSILHVVRFKDLIKYTLVGYAAVIAINFFTKTFTISRLQAVYTILLLLPGILIIRSLIDLLWYKVIIGKFKAKRLLVYGAGDTGKRLAKSVRKYIKLGYRPVGFIDDHRKIGEQVTSNPLFVLGDYKDIKRVIKEKGIHELWVAMPKASSKHVVNVMKACVEMGIPYRFVPNFNELALHRVDMNMIDGVPLFGCREVKTPYLYLLIKRIFDIITSTVILVALSPVMLFIAWRIKRDSPGPVIFKQKRVGKDGVEFDFYKFRSMYIDASKYAVNPTLKDDPRVTPFGKILRRTSLDEFPQFLNVLKGDMSIVGPRPEMPFIVAEYNDVHRERLKVLPGITGIWQISGDRSLPIHENIDHDLYYIEHQSPLLDIVIIIQTIFFAIRGIGAL